VKNKFRTAQYKNKNKKKL